MKYLRHLLLKILLKHLYRAVTVDELLVHKGTTMYINGKPLSNDEKQGIIREAQYLRRSHLLRMLFSELRLAANQQIIEKATTVDGMIAGRLQMLAIDTLEQLIVRVSEAN
jgi:hypothetical protein